MRDKERHVREEDEGGSDSLTTTRFKVSEPPEKHLNLSVSLMVEIKQRPRRQSEGGKYHRPESEVTCLFSSWETSCRARLQRNAPQGAVESLRMASQTLGAYVRAAGQKKE